MLFDEEEEENEDLDEWLEDNDEDLKYKLLDSLKTLWIGRFVSYAKQVESMDINDAEIIIQKQAEIFENKFEYLKSIY